MPHSAMQRLHPSAKPEAHSSDLLTWNRLSLPCLALPPAESPSTMNTSEGTSTKVRREAQLEGGTHTV